MPRSKDPPNVTPITKSKRSAGRAKKPEPADEAKKTVTPDITPDLLDQIRMVPTGRPSDLPILNPESPEAQWVLAQGQSPVEFLTTVYRNSWLPVEQRVSAAKAVLEYVHRKLPAKMEVSAQLFGQLDLSQLNDEELGALTKIMDKAKMLS